MKPYRFARIVTLLCLLFLTTNLFTTQMVSSAPLNSTSVGCSVAELITAINVAGSGDTLDLASGCTYTLTAVNNTDYGGNGLPVINKVLTINGHGAVIERSAIAGTPEFRIFRILAGGNLTVDNLTVRNGFGHGQGGGLDNQGVLTVSNSAFTANYVKWVSIGTGYGAAIYNFGTLVVSASTFSNNVGGTGGGGIGNFGSATLNNCMFSNNTASGYDGAGIFNTGPLTVNDTSFISNSAVLGSGGAISHRGNGNTILNNTIFSNNGARTGGAIYNNSANLTVTNSSFTANNATQNGGSIFNSTGAMNIVDSTFNVNTATNGGGVYNGGTATIIRTTFTDNTAPTVGSGYGGGVQNWGTLTMSNSTVVNNSAYYGGGGIDNRGTLTVSSNTISGNSAQNGGGITSYSGTVTMGGNIVALNTSSSGSPDLHGLVLTTAPFVSLGYNVIGSTVDVTITGNTSADLTDAAASPLNLGILTDNGGATQTIALLPGSVAIDAGDNTLCPALDQRGITRPLDGDGNGSAICDVGAYEAAYLPSPTLISPFGVQETQPLSYSFNAVDNAGWYYLWLSSDSGHVMDQWYSAVDICTGGICTITPSVSYSPQNYQWWVQAWGDSFGYTEWSDPLSFSFGTPNTPTQIAPIGVIDDTSPSFQWSDEPGLTWYNIWIVLPDGSGQEFWYEDWAICASNVCSVEPLNINNGIYTWWVRGWVNGQYTDWSPAAYFQLPIGTATLTAPSGTISMTQPSFSWTHVPSAYWYYLWVSNDVTGYVMDQWYNTYNGVCEVAGNTCTVTPALNLENGNYTFWVQAWSPIAGYGSWSAPQPFNVNVAPIVNEDVPVETVPSVTEVIPTLTPMTEITPAETALHESSTGS